MAASTRYKVYDPCKYYESSCKDLGAAKLVAVYLGPGSKVRDGTGGKVVYEVIKVPTELKNYLLIAIGEENG